MVCFYAWAYLGSDPPTYTSHVTGQTGVHHRIQLFYWLRQGSLQFFTQTGLKPQFPHHCLLSG
jgi:hypothetical protein